MNKKVTVSSRDNRFRLTIVLVIWAAIIAAALWNPFGGSDAATNFNASDVYKRMAPNTDLNSIRGLQNMRPATAQQLQALNALKSSTGSPNMMTRWDTFGGSIDTMYNFVSRPLSGTPEEAARSFISQNAVLFGVSSINDLVLFNQKDALGGHLLRFKQIFNGVDVTNGGIGIVLNGNNQVVMASGPFFRDVNINTNPTISAAQATQA